MRETSPLSHVTECICVLLGSESFRKPSYSSVFDVLVSRSHELYTKSKYSPLLEARMADDEPLRLWRLSRFTLLTRDWLVSSASDAILAFFALARTAWPDSQRPRSAVHTHGKTNEIRPMSTPVPDENGLSTVWVRQLIVDDIRFQFGNFSTCRRSHCSRASPNHPIVPDNCHTTVLP